MNTLSIEQTAHLGDIGRTTAYVHARSGQLFGVPVLRVGKAYRVPLRPVAEALGMTVDEVVEALSRESEPSGKALPPGVSQSVSPPPSHE